MRLCVTPLPLILSAVLTSCHPPLALQYRQALRPAPSHECVASAVLASPVVATASPIGPYDTWFAHGPGLIIALRDSTARVGTLAVSVTHSTLPDSALHIAVTYEYVGHASPTALKRERWAGLAGELIAAVGATCARDAPAAAVECRQLGPFGKKQSCDSTQPNDR